jgi:predicted porin
MRILHCLYGQHTAMMGVGAIVSKLVAKSQQTMRITRFLPFLGCLPLGFVGHWRWEKRAVPFPAIFSRFSKRSITMQKKLIALAVAGLASTGAFAQSNVTIFGAMDLMLMQASGTSNGINGANAAAGTLTGVGGTGTAADPNRGAQTTMNTGTGRTTSHVGFRGTEDLGGGLKANFVVISTVTADGATGQAAPTASGTSGAGLFGDREAVLGLSGGFGDIRFGRQHMYQHDTFGSFDANGDKGPGSFSWLLLSGSNSRVNNAIKYTSPDMSGFKVTYQVAMSEFQDSVVAAAGQTGTISGLSLNYSGGPFAAQLGQLVHRDLYAGLAAPVRGRNLKLNHLGMSYDFGAAKLLGNYVTTETSLGATIAGVADTIRSIDATTYSLGVVVPMNAHAFKVQYVSANDKRVHNQDATSWFLGYDYTLSKRTSVYAGTAAVSNKNGAQFSANADTTAAVTGVTRGSNAVGTAATAAQGGRTSAYYVGMRHNF